jgi:hypothetical protein
MDQEDEVEAELPAMATASAVSFVEGKKGSEGKGELRKRG